MPISCTVEHGSTWRILSQLHPLAIKQKHYIYPIFEVTLAKNQAAQALSSSLNFISVAYFFLWIYVSCRRTNELWVWESRDGLRKSKSVEKSKNWESFFPLFTEYLPLGCKALGFFGVLLVRIWLFDHLGACKLCYLCEITLRKGIGHSKLWLSVV